MWDTLKAYNKPDDIVERSAFLTNRRGSDPLVKMYEDNTYANKVLAWIENAKGHGGDLMGIGFEMVDHFTADSVIRGRYIENIRRGMSEEAAMDEADDLGALIFADRSKGGLPTIFSAKEPDY
jgi:hypothetical protein